MPSKSTKDTNAPKKPLSAYLLFSADERPKLKASGLDNFAEMSRALGAAWKQADQKTKSHYEKEHDREKARYENELKEYEKSGQTVSSSKSVKKDAPVSTKSKKTTSTVKNVEPTSDDEDDFEESEEEEEKPAPPTKGASKKI